jgi:hypothetical protein
MKLALPACAALVVLASVLAGCGGSSPPSVASTTASSSPSSSSSSTALAQGIRYSRCMRSHGIANFPDPQPGATIKSFKIVLANGAGSGAIDLHSNAFRRAATSCAPLLPRLTTTNSAPTAQQIAGLLSFARCMRARGFGQFPDPTQSGGLTLEAVEAAGVDISSPKVQAAATACLPAAHGALTAAQVERAEQEAKAQQNGTAGGGG